MKIKFEDNLDYQLEAIDSIVNIFEGQESLDSNFTVGKINRQQSSFIDNDLGIANKMIINEEDLLENIKKIQLKNGLPQSNSINVNKLNFTIEMETGTGKTYVYLRTILEMNKKYGFKKFIIVVPSIAIKEGTKKSLEITKDHFKGLYNNVTYSFFDYDSQKLEQVRSFATSNNIEIMVINIGAFNKSFKDPSRENKANIIHRYNDRLSGYKPIDFISETNPIVIIDEPQTVDNTDKSSVAIASLKPLCTLRYSATHRVKENMMYKLDSIDAYEKRLVKQIEVAGIQAPENKNGEYIKVISIKSAKAGLSAELELDVRQKTGIKRMKKKVKHGDHLETITKNANYEGYFVNEISVRDEKAEMGVTYIDLFKEKLVVGQLLGGESPDTIKRLQIRKTIEEHLDKKQRLNPEGIKVLSLFFIDRVANYRTHDNEGNAIMGKYAEIFEEEYIKLIDSGKYTTLGTNLVDLKDKVNKIHNGYFSGDKKKTKDGKEFILEKDTSGVVKADNDTFNLIMKEKERLLSMNEPLEFIFSHSALKEGWDNPNVFQICTLNETSSEMKKRQEIGRGLRICVNQQGERVKGFEYNSLTVMANESYEEFLKELQSEIEEETGIKFGFVSTHMFANIIMHIDGINQESLGEKKSKVLYEHLKEMKYIDTKDKVTDKLKTALKANLVEIPEEFIEIKSQILGKLKKVAGNLNIKNNADKKTVKINKRILLSDDFKELWDKVKYKTKFKVDFDNDELIKKCSESLGTQLSFADEKYKYFKVKTEITKGGVGVVTGSNVEDSIDSYTVSRPNIPDILSYIQSETSLTRRSIADIIVNSKTEIYLKRNPQRYVDEAIKIIKNTMSHFIIDGIKYEKLDNEFYGQELFDTNELKVHFKDGMIESKKSPYTYVVDDSNIEKNIAERFEASSNVKVYAKLPSWFKIDTPIGSYNPDWAVLYEKDGNEKLYLVVETKGTLFAEELREKEKAKIECGKKHFKAIGLKHEMIQTNSFDNLEDRI
jgi:type III restriction enzyme